MSEDQVDQSVETDTNPGVEESASQAEPSGSEAQESATEAKQEAKQVPFHEHPRFKELIEQNRSFKEQDSQRAQVLESMQRELQALRQSQTPKAEKAKDPFLAELEKINPDYAKSLESVYKRAEIAESVRAELDQMKAQQFAQSAYSKFDSLVAANKVPDSMKDLYKDTVEAEVYRREARGEKLGLQHLETIFKQVHEKYTKFMEENNRQVTAKYVTAKKSDTAPKGATGGAATIPGMKKMAAGDTAAQAKWLADQIRQMKKQ